MGHAQPTPEYTKEDYLRMDADSEMKLDFYKGEVFSMAGAAPDHDRIVGSVTRHVGNALEGKACEVFTSDMRVSNATGEFYTYPDATVACPPIDFDFTEKSGTLRNPKVIFEVLSPSTAAYDQSRKFEQYRLIKSLEHVVFVASTEVRVTVFTRANDFWIFRELVEMEDVLDLPAINVAIPVSALYQRVEFTDTQLLEEPAFQYPRQPDLVSSK